MKILALNGSPRKGITYRAVEQLSEEMSRLGDFQFQQMMIKDLKLGICRGCFLCLEKERSFVRCRMTPG